MFWATLYLNIMQCKNIFYALKLTHKRTNSFVSFFTQTVPHNSAPEIANDVSCFPVPKVLVLQVHRKIFLTFNGKNIYSAPEALNVCISFNVLNNFYKTFIFIPIYLLKNQGSLRLENLLESYS